MNLIILKKDCLKFDSEVVSDNDKNEFLEILKTGKINDSYKSQYAKIFKLFQDKVEEFIHDMPDYFSLLVARIMKY